MQNLDTHKLIEKFISLGVPKEQAEIYVEAGIIIAKAQFDNFEKDYSNLVTKNDLKVSFMEFKEELMKELDLKFTTKDDLKIAISDLRNEIKEVRNEIKESKYDILKWIMPCFITIIGLLIGISIKIIAG